jgi:hypothetical protein
MDEHAKQNEDENSENYEDRETHDEKEHDVK